ncbi:hypothetical protein RvY_10665 [Ramazzottius varieornatus]|uniref:TOG domain-containing protein n=1 Tax=Ramazzottius varieornatus TaxID=947166 RepID=A0A1D1VFY1_RAMVA|nr:hypothetical protein RvY_10665 [Ramazzottius varieornatus]
MTETRKRIVSSNTEVERPIQPAPVADDDTDHRPSSPPSAAAQVETSGETMRKQRAEPKGNDRGRGNTTTKKGRKARTDLPPGFQYAVEVFGDETVEEILSAAFVSRLHGLERMKEITDAAVESRPSGYPVMWLIRGSVVVLEEMLKEDAVIIQLTAHVLLKLLRDIVPRYSDARADVPLIFNMALPFALSRLGNTSRRISQILMPFAVELASMNLAKDNVTVMQTIFEEFKPTAQVRYSVGRLRIVQDLIFLLPVSETNTGMTVELVVGFALSAMEHSEREVRRGGEKILIWLYDKPPPPTFKPILPSSTRKALYRDSIRALLPRDVIPEGEKAKRDFRYRGLFRVLAQIDQGDKSNVPQPEPRLRSPALAPEHAAFYSKWYRLNRGEMDDDENEMDRAESRSQIRVVLSRNLKVVQAIVSRRM